MDMRSFLFFILFVCTTSVFSQKVEGSLYDSNDLPLSDVFIHVEGSDVSTNSDSIGNYSIELPEGFIQLRFQKEGYETQLITVASAVVNVTLYPDFTALFHLDIEHLLNVKITTASKKSQEINEVPANVVLITRKDIQTQGYQTLEDLISDIPGFYSLGNGYFFGGTNYGVRGFSTIGSFTNVMILVNGVNQMEDFSNGFSTDKITVPIQAIDRVEVIKGPMGVFYGSTAFFGVINIITDEYKEGESNNAISSSYGSLNTLETFARLTGVEGDFKYSFNGSYSKSDGMDIPYSELQSNEKLLKNAYGIEEGATTKNQLGYANKYFNFSGNFKGFSFNVDFSDRGEGMMGLVPALDFDRGWYAKISATTISAAYTKQVRKAHLKLRYTTSIYEYKAERIDIIRVNNYNSLGVQTSAQEIDLNVVIPFSKKVELNAGISDRIVGKVDRQIDAKLLGLQDRSTSINAPFNTFSAFTELEYRPFKKILIIGGARVEKTNDYSIVSYSFDSANVFGEERNNKTDIGDLQFIPRVATIYKFSDTKSVKLMYSQSKKRPSFVELDNRFESNLGSLNFAEIKTLESNYNQSFKNVVNFNVGVFYNDLSNLIIRTVEIIDNKSVSSSSNKGRLTTIGSEITVKANVTKKWTNEVSVVYQKSEDKTPGLENANQAFSPEWLAYFKTSYTFSEKLSIGVKARYVDEMLAEYNPKTDKRFSETTPSYMVFDLNISSTFYKGMYASFLVTNVMGTEVRYGSNQYVGWVNKGLLGYGRRMNLTLGYKF